MRSRRGNKPVIRLILVLLIAAALGFAGYRYMQIRQADEQAEAVLDSMYKLVPGLGVETGISTGQGRDPLPILAINGIDIVGCLEIPSIDLMVPVTASTGNTTGTSAGTGSTSSSGNDGSGANSSSGEGSTSVVSMGDVDAPQGFVTIASGSPVKGKLRIKGSREDSLRTLAQAKPGDNVYFTDVDGVRYAYKVVTQYHLKNWDEGDNDLLVCYDTDSQTQFVLGCTRAE